MEHDFAVLVPAYQPDERLTKLAAELREKQLAVVVVDDGSTQGKDVFAELESLGCTVLRHEKNCGKGRALKTGIAWLNQQGFAGVVTADADGQHTCLDILRVGETLYKHPGELVLGVRKVAEMPPPSRFGNALTCKLFSLLYGVRLTDTQTGLRGIPLEERTAALLALAGERYEYEMNMLVLCPELFSGVKEVPIETIYIGKNESSHFRPLVDGAKIYGILFCHFPKFLLVSLASFAIDYAIFNGLYYLVFRNAVIATVAARVLSSVANFALNKHFVFATQSKQYTLLRYYSLAVFILFCNMGLMHIFVDVLGLPAAGIKIGVEAVLYVVSFCVQTHFSHAKQK